MGITRKQSPLRRERISDIDRAAVSRATEKKKYWSREEKVDYRRQRSNSISPPHYKEESQRRLAADYEGNKLQSVSKDRMNVRVFF